MRAQLGRGGGDDDGCGGGGGDGGRSGARSRGPIGCEALFPLPPPGPGVVAAAAEPLLGAVRVAAAAMVPTARSIFGRAETTTSTTTRASRPMRPETLNGPRMPFRRRRYFHANEATSAIAHPSVGRRRLGEL